MSRSPLTRRKLVRFWRLPGEERVLLVRAAAWLLAVDLGLRVVGFTRVRRFLGRGVAPPGEPAAGRERRREVAAVAWCVGAAARHHLYPIPCLPRSLVLWRLLARRGIPSELCIGVRHEDRGLRAHAWVEHAGRPVGEAEDVRSLYAPVALPTP